MNRFQCSKAHFVTLESCPSKKGVTFCPHANHGEVYCLIIVLQIDLRKCLVLFSPSFLLGSVSLCLAIAKTFVCNAACFAMKSWVKMCFLDALWIDRVGKSLKNVILRLKARL